MPTPAYSGRTQHADEWLRDLTGQLDRGLTVIASREPLRWEITDPEWADDITTVAVDGLPMASRLELLEAGGFSDPATRQAVAEASAGLPFYLHLAVDSQQKAGGSMGGVIVSQNEILARFLQHVAPEEVRTLDILAPARIFDYEIFRQLTAAFELPGSRLAWDSLTAYSFVYPAGDGLRLHQLIRVAIIDRLPAPTLAQIHATLSGLWEDLARRRSGTGAARAYREAAYHGLHAGTVGAPGLLRFADLAIRQGGHGAAGGIAQDLEEWLAGQPGDEAGTDSDTALAVRCLRAEAADPVSARLAVAAGNGQRIAGNTRAALEIFTRVWDIAGGPPKLTAGLWACDLLMCQGKFREAEELAAKLEALVPEDEVEFRGDVARMRHLSRRFAFDYGAAERYLDDAACFYQAADSVLGLANISTNRAELLALTRPGEAIAEAGRAIETQREIGAHHEIGKAYTALGVAQLRLGELDRAEAALRSAFASLDQAGYRSGRARAELYMAAVHGRRAWPPRQARRGAHIAPPGRRRAGSR
ncbi:MAG TPA: hypothetical protein VMU94_30145 [Streptosporangiaceae bacterium]|nr:hypothetical protein [Streptosporangiaceae bacterium]